MRYSFIHTIRELQNDDLGSQLAQLLGERMSVNGELANMSNEHVNLIIMNMNESFGYILTTWQEYIHET